MKQGGKKRIFSPVAPHVFLGCRKNTDILKTAKSMTKTRVDEYAHESWINIPWTTSAHMGTSMVVITIRANLDILGPLWGALFAPLFSADFSASAQILGEKLIYISLFAQKVNDLTYANDALQIA